MIPFPFLMTPIYCILERQQQVLYVTCQDWPAVLQLQGLCQSHLKQLLWTLLQRAPCRKPVPKCSSHTAHSKPCYKLRYSSTGNYHAWSAITLFLRNWITAIYTFCMPFLIAEFLLQNSSCKGKKKVRSWRTGDEGEDVALPIIQRKGKGFIKKTPTQTPPK